MRHLAPYVLVRIAEAPECAQPFGIDEDQRWAVETLRVVKIGLATGGLRTVEPDFCVRAVAERLSLRVAASAQRIIRFGPEPLALPPGLRIPVGISDDGLRCERNAAGDEIRAVL
jgi:hypothetical protein